MTDSIETELKRHAVAIRQRLMNPCTNRLVASYEEKIRDLEEQLTFARNHRVQSMEALIANEQKAMERVGELEAIVERLQERLRKTYVAIGELDGEITRRDLLKPAEIIAEVLKAYPAITPEDIVGPSLERYLTEPRGLCIHQVHKLRPDLSFPMLGKIFNRDHSTIMRTCRIMALKDKLQKEATHG